MSITRYGVFRDKDIPDAIRACEEELREALE